MKKWVLLAIAVGAIVFMWWYVRTYQRFTPPWMMPKWAEITRGDIKVPISASGLIEPRQRIEVKSKASGEVIAVEVEAGDFVRTGDRLVVLKRDDEERNVSRAQADLNRFTALLEQARLAVQRAEVSVLTAEARVAELEAQERMAEFELNKVLGLAEREQASPQELIDAPARRDISRAQLKAARASLDSAKLAVADARQAVSIQEAAVSVAQTELADAEERLLETTVVAAQDALVTEVNVRVGEVIQSGKTSLTGGTVLMRLADISELKVVTRVDEADYGRVLDIAPDTALPQMGALRAAEAAATQEIRERSGQVQVTVDAFPDLTFTGLIERVEPQGKLSPGSAIIQFDVHVLITDEKRHKLLLGTQAQVEFLVETARDVLRVPADAVKALGEQRGLYLKVAPPEGTTDKFGQQFVPVAFGITDGTYTQVVRALNDTELTEGLEVYTKLPTSPREED
jgi:HlyD family secretion protein